MVDTSIAGEMPAIILDPTSGHPALTTLPIPSPSSSNATVRVILAGVCATDLALIRGYKNSPRSMVLGHEFVGVITSCPPSSHLSIGERVVAEINCVHANSTASRNWRERAQDASRTALGIFGSHGCFAPYVSVPVENLHAVPEGVSDEDAVFTEPLAAACQVLEENFVRPSETVAVLGGAGRLGSLVTGVLAVCGYNVVALVRKREGEGETSAEAKHLEKMMDAQVNVKYSEDVEGGSFDCVVDCTGSPEGLGMALGLVKPRGKIVLKSTYEPSKLRESSLDLSALVVKEVQVTGSRCGPFAVALSLLDKKVLRPSVLISGVFPISSVGEVFESADKAGVLKVLINPWSETNKSG